MIHENLPTAMLQMLSKCYETCCKDETGEVSELAISRQLLQDQEVLGCHGARARDSSDCLSQTNRQTGGLAAAGTDSSFTGGAATFAKKVGCQIRFKLVVVMMDHFSRACQEVTWYKFLSHKLMRVRIEKQAN